MTLLSNVRIGTRLAIGFAVVLGLTIISSTFALISARDNAAATRHMMESPLAKERLISDWYVLTYSAIARTSMIAKTKPDRVLLAAKWSFADSKAISKTIAVLKGLGIRQVSVVGPVPQWDEAPSKTVYRAFRKDRVFHGLPARVNSGLNKRTELDENLRLIVEGAGAEYISARNILCNDSGCLTRVGESLDSLVVWDTSHFTRAGSQFVVSRFP